MMADVGLDMIVAYAAFCPIHASWFANFPVHFEPVCILMPRTGGPVILVRPESDEYALLAGQIPDVRIYYLYPLAAAGQAGVECALGFMRDGIERDMKLMGQKSIDGLFKSNLRFQ